MSLASKALVEKKKIMSLNMTINCLNNLDISLKKVCELNVKKFWSTLIHHIHITRYFYEQTII